MIDSTLDAALARGAFVVTPNKRLAREIGQAYDARRLAEGRLAWPSARALPWGVFVGELLQRAQDAALAVPVQRLDERQSHELWRRVVVADRTRPLLVDPDALAGLASEAWERLHAWGSGGESWRGFGDAGEDVAAFAAWAETHARELARLDAVDAARAADAVANVADALPEVSALDVVLAGFTELSPQQQRLLEALGRAGARVAYPLSEPPAIDGSNARLAACETSRDELARALDWARARALADPDARIGVVVLDLAARRAEAHAACEERLCAPLMWPGRHDELRPYDLSLGEALSATPLVASALALLALAHGSIDRARACALVRSPYLPEAASMWMRRASLERRWIERGVRELDWRTLVDDLADVDGALASRWRRAGIVLRRWPRAAPRAWVDRWRAWLEALGWCERASLASAEFQAQGAWNELLGTFVRLAAVVPSLPGDEALATLARLAREQLFQPQSTGARIRVLGLLEATGLAFDALWVAGMVADDWPRPAEPNPMLPLAWQRERNVPRASAERELAFAREVTAQLAHAAPEVVFSYAAVADDHRRTPSPLVAGLPPFEARAPRQTAAERMFEQRPALETLSDAFAPAIPEGAKLPGGTGLIEKVNACPFQASAVYRLRAETWPASGIGLAPIERGHLVHATLDAFWRDVRTHAALAAMDEQARDAAIDAGFNEARKAIDEARWNALPPAVAASEAGAVRGLVRQWLDVDGARPPFEVIEREARATVTIAGHTLETKLDRVDALASGGVAVIDYKTGFATGPARWFEERPQGLQLAVYAHARAQHAPERPVRALAYAQLRAGAVRAIGVVDDAAQWPALALAGDVKGAGLADWHDANARLAQALASSVSAFARGDARIAPRQAAVCRSCRLAALCRVGAVDDGSAAEEESDVD